MEPPPPAGIDAIASDCPLVELSAALKGGRLVALLRGNGLNKQTVEELLRPESIATLRSMLTELPCAPGVADDPLAGHGSGPFRSAGGKVLAFRRKRGPGRMAPAGDPERERKAANPVAGDE